MLKGLTVGEISLASCSKRWFPIKINKVYVAFYAFLLLIGTTYVMYNRLYGPLLLPVVFTSRDFVLHNPHLCSGPEDVTLMYIYTSTGAFRTRDAIRRTFGNHTLLKKYNLRTLFVLGKDHSCDSETIQQHIQTEFSRYRDILVGDFWDSYRNLSLKGIVALDFAHRHCKNARFVIKADDDVFVNTPALLHDLYNEQQTAKRTVWGKLISNAKALYCITRAFNKWCILYSHYNRTYYPPYMYGVGFVLTGDLVSPMLNASEKVLPFPIDDVYMTGLLLEHVKQVKMVDWDKYVAPTPEVAKEWLDSPHKNKIYFAHSVTPEQILEGWKKLHRPQRQQIEVMPNQQHRGK